VRTFNKKYIRNLTVATLTIFQTACSGTQLANIEIFEDVKNQPIPVPNIPVPVKNDAEDALALLSAPLQKALGKQGMASAVISYSPIVNVTSSDALPKHVTNLTLSNFAEIGHPIYVFNPKRALYLKNKDDIVVDLVLDGAIVAYDSGVYGKSHDNDAGVSAEFGRIETDFGVKFNASVRYSRVMVELSFWDPRVGILKSSVRNVIYVADYGGSQSLDAFILSNGGSMRTNIQRKAGVQGSLPKLLSYSVLELVCNTFGLDHRVLLEKSTEGSIDGAKEDMSLVLQERFKGLSDREQVIEIQTLLNKANLGSVWVNGHGLVSKLAVNGKLDVFTTAFISHFQKTKNQKVVDYFGRKEIAELYSQLIGLT